MREAKDSHWIEELNLRFRKTHWWGGTNILENYLGLRFMVRIEVLVHPRGQAEFVDAYRALERYASEYGNPPEFSDDVLEAIAAQQAAEYETGKGSVEHGCDIQ